MNQQTHTARVEKALAEIATKEQPVTLTAAAAASGISRSTLYRNPALRALIQNYRHRHSPDQTFNRLTTEIGQLRTSVEALADRLRRLERINTNTTKK